MIKRLSFLLAMVFGLASCNSESASSNIHISNGDASAEVGQAANVRSIGSLEAKALLEEQGDIIILDVRTPKEYIAGHLIGAQHIDFYAPDFSKQLQALDPDKAYVVYCAVGGRSSKAAEMMKKIGFKQVYEASEGFPALEKSGIPVEEGSQK
ncbi:MAG: rhodanese-like domain-containing protein [Anditalea sp.]